MASDWLIRSNLFLVSDIWVINALFEVSSNAISCEIAEARFNNRSFSLRIASRFFTVVSEIIISCLILGMLSING